MDIKQPSKHKTLSRWIHVCWEKSKHVISHDSLLHATWPYFAYDIMLCWKTSTTRILHNLRTFLAVCNGFSGVWWRHRYFNYTWNGFTLLSGRRSFKFLSGPGPGRALVLLLIKATDAISLERVGQAALPLGNQFAMADAHGGKLACCPTAVLQKVSTIPLLTLLSSCFELEAVACSSFCRWTSEYLNHLINQIAAQKDALYI